MAAPKNSKHCFACAQNYEVLLEHSQRKQPLSRLALEMGVTYETLRLRISGKTPIKDEAWYALAWYAGVRLGIEGVTRCECGHCHEWCFYVDLVTI